MKEESGDWFGMETAPQDGTPIALKFVENIAAYISKVKNTDKVATLGYWKNNQWYNYYTNQPIVQTPVGWMPF